MVSQLQIKAHQVYTQSMGNEHLYYYEEEDPLRIVSTTALEERLKDLDEQRRILEALQQLGGANFDLTADTPMLQDGLGRQEMQRVQEGEQGEAAGAASPVRVAEEEVHEFQRLAHTLKLARSLSVKCEVDADVDVPYQMIADLETYPLWMPWCTSGRVLGDTSAPQFDGEVGFGFETGTFLGTVGDTVSYRVSVRAPGSGEPASSGPPCELAPDARVTADAVNGFTYGQRLVYDWRFHRLGSKRTKVELDMLFQARSVLYMPIWDSMQNMVVNNMLSAFIARAELLQRQKSERDTAEHGDSFGMVP